MVLSRLASLKSQIWPWPVLTFLGARPSRGERQCCERSGEAILCTWNRQVSGQPAHAARCPSRQHITGRMSAQHSPRTLEDIYEDFELRRSGLLQALTTGMGVGSPGFQVSKGLPSQRSKRLTTSGPACRGGGFLQAVRSRSREPVPVWCASSHPAFTALEPGSCSYLVPGRSDATVQASLTAPGASNFRQRRSLQSCRSPA